MSPPNCVSFTSEKPQVREASLHVADAAPPADGRGSSAHLSKTNHDETHHPRARYDSEPPSASLPSTHTHSHNEPSPQSPSQSPSFSSGSPTPLERRPLKVYPSAVNPSDSNAVLPNQPALALERPEGYIRIVIRPNRQLAYCTEPGYACRA